MPSLFEKQCCSQHEDSPTFPRPVLINGDLCQLRMSSKACELLNFLFSLSTSALKKVEDVEVPYPLYQDFRLTNFFKKVTRDIGWILGWA